MTGNNDMKVSCLLVSLPVIQRFGYLQRSVADYCRQTYANRELIIVIDEGDEGTQSAIAAHVASLGRDDIRIVQVPGRRLMGVLRNISRDNARGDILCQWDDDDLHHPQRIEMQLDALVAADAQSVCLGEVMQYFVHTRTLYCTNWHATEARSMPGTVMWRREAPIRYPESGPSARLGEDSVVAAQLQALGAFHVLQAMPHLYVYVSHGTNSWPDQHHQMLATKLAMSKGLLARREAALREGLRAFDFGPDAVAVRGYNGLAFTLTIGE